MFGRKRVEPVADGLSGPDDGPFLDAPEQAQFVLAERVGESFVRRGKGNRASAEETHHPEVARCSETPRLVFGFSGKRRNPKGDARLRTGVAWLEARAIFGAGVFAAFGADEVGVAKRQAELRRIDGAVDTRAQEPHLRHPRSARHRMDAPVRMIVGK